MIKKAIIFTVFFVLPFIFVNSQQQEIIPNVEQLHSDKVKEANEYLKMRMEYAQSGDYNPYNSEVTDITGECTKLIDEGKFKEAIEKANEGLAKDRYNIQLLIKLASVYRKIGDIENADKHRKLWIGLMDSIILSGDGRTSETAFKVINVAEEYAVLLVLKLENTKQRLIEKNDSEFDILTVKDIKTGAVSELYFNVDIPFKWLLKKNQAEEK